MPQSRQRHGIRHRFGRIRILNAVDAESRGSHRGRYSLHVAVVAMVLALVSLPLDTSSFLAVSLPQKSSYVQVSFGQDDRLLESRGVRPQVVSQPREVLDRLAVVKTIQGTYPQYEPSQYVVQPGDTLSTVAQVFGLSQKTVLWANESLVEEQDLLSVGQELVIPPVDGALHRVAEGETLQGIADKYQVVPEQILTYAGNVFGDDGQLVADTLLVVPDAYLPDPPPKVVPTPVPQRAVVQQAKVAEPVSGSGSMAWPLNGLITQGYGGYHPAVDIHTKAGVPVVAADGGTVTLVSWQNYSYGYHVIVEHGDGVETLYAHLSAISVEAGQVLAQGQEVGLVGSTGRSTGPHLHFEVRKSGVHCNPFSYLP